MGMMLRRHLRVAINTTVNEQAEAVEQTAKKQRATRKAK